MKKIVKKVLNFSEKNWKLIKLGEKIVCATYEKGLFITFNAA